MLTSHRVPTTAHLYDARTGRHRRRRLVVPLLTAALGLGAVGGVFGFTTSPGRTRSGVRQTEVAVPGVRGTGGGGARLYAVSSSPGVVQLAVRKAGGGPIEYL